MINFEMFFIGNLLAGFATFAPKFIEAQFSLQASNAAQYVGKSWHSIYLNVGRLSWLVVDFEENIKLNKF